jgi:hypothetical protein
MPFKTVPYFSLEQMPYELISMREWSRPSPRMRPVRQLPNATGRDPYGSWYGILGVPVDASFDDLRQAFERLAETHHPDNGGDAEEWEDIIYRYEFLSDPLKRPYYDMYHESGPRDVYQHLTNVTRRGRGRSMKQLTLITIKMKRTSRNERWGFRVNSESIVTAVREGHDSKPKLRVGDQILTVVGDKKLLDSHHHLLEPSQVLPIRRFRAKTTLFMVIRKFGKLAKAKPPSRRS